MSRKSRQPIRGQFVPISVELLKTRVWRLLPTSARALWPEIVWHARKQTHGEDSQPFVFPQRHPAFSKNTVTAAICAMRDLGLLEVHRQGGLLANANQYRLSDGWRTWSPAQTALARRADWQRRLDELLRRERLIADAAEDARNRRVRVLRQSDTSEVSPKNWASQSQKMGR